MSGRYLLDTSVVVGFLRGEEAISSRVDAATGICISVTVLGELLYGAERSTRREQALREVNGFLLDCSALDCDQTTAGFYSRIRAALAARGKPIPENDIWKRGGGDAAWAHAGRSG